MHPNTTVFATVKGRNFTPNNTLPMDTTTWTAIKTHLASLDRQEATIQQLKDLVPHHQCYIAYALRNGWLSC